MGYTWNNTVCVFTDNSEVNKQVVLFADKHRMSVYKADNESDLIGVPFWLAIVDINMVSNYVIQVLKESSEPSEAKDESINDISYDVVSAPMIITHTQPSVSLSLLPQNIIVIKTITNETLQEITKDSIPSQN